MSLTVTATASPNSGVDSVTTTLEATVSGGTPPYNIRWSTVSDGFTFAAGEEVVYDLSDAGTTTFRADATDQEGITGDATVNVTVTTFHVAAAASPTAGTVPLEITLTATPTGGAGAIEYLWLLDGEVVATGDSATYAADYAGNYLFTCLATDAGFNTDLADVYVEVAPDDADPPDAPAGFEKTQKWPHRASPVAVVSPAGRSIPYWPQPMTFSETYTENNGAVTTMNLAVDGENASAFISSMMPSVRRVYNAGVVSLSRWVPHQFPNSGGQFLAELALAEKAQSGTDPNAPGWPTWGWCVYRGKWVSQPFAVVSDADVPKLADGTPNELYRNVTRRNFPTARERKINTHQVETVPVGNSAPQNIGEVAHLPEPETGWTYTVTWPLRAVPRAAIAFGLGRANDTQFDTVPGVGGNFNPGCLIFDAVDIEGPFQQFDGTLLVVLHYHFREKPYPWANYVPPNWVPKVEGNWPSIPLRWRIVPRPPNTPDTPTVAPFDFQRLFKPV